MRSVWPACIRAVITVLARSSPTDVSTWWSAGVSTMWRDAQASVIPLFVQR